MSEQIRHRIEEVVANQSRFEAVLLSMYEGTMVVDKDNTIILMNQVLRDLFFLEQDPLGQKPLEVIRNIDIQVFWKHRLTGELYPLLMYNQSSINVKMMFRKRDFNKVDLASLE